MTITLFHNDALVLSEWLFGKIIRILCMCNIFIYDKMLLSHVFSSQITITTIIDKAKSSRLDISNLHQIFFVTL